MIVGARVLASKDEHYHCFLLLLLAFGASVLSTWLVLPFVEVLFLA